MNLENLLHILTLHVSDLSVVLDLAPVAFGTDKIRAVTAGEHAQAICRLAG